MSDSSSERTVAERVTMTFSIVIIIGIVGLAFWANARIGETPAAFHVEPNLENIRESDGRFYVPVTIMNSGGLTAQNVVVTGELDLGDGEPETGDVTIDFLAGGESEEATLVFSSHPEDGEFEVGVTSYLKP